ncbi:MAG: SDR family oxidoreductase [Chloroflexi bacterium]|nr:SDR family oxidoreductase [Chloroflexota bacterium]MBV9600280.1 SDR family oxidoreductase [Chloroflexota bacterium]
MTTPRDKEDLSGRVALVTGATSDIGAATAQALARRGADLVLHGHTNADRLASLRDELEVSGRRVRVIQADLTDYHESRRLASEATDFAPIDILINNAGNILRRVHWTELEPTHLDRVFGLNYRAPLFLAQSLSPGMIERGRGVIINILSTAYVSGGTDTVYAYASAKGALWTLTHALANSLAPRGVRVLAVCPGTVDTAFQREPFNRALVETWIDNIPLKRIGQPVEIGDVVAFMATDAASFVVGDTIHVNGGIYMS